MFFSAVMDVSGHDHKCFLWGAQPRSTTRSFEQWNLILAHSQHSKTLEIIENKGSNLN